MNYLALKTFFFTLLTLAVIKSYCRNAYPPLDKTKNMLLLPLAILVELSRFYGIAKVKMS